MRLWELRLQVYKALPELPVPNIIVEEVQDNPSYRLSGVNRKKDRSCQLVYTLEGEGRFSEKKREHVLSTGKAFLAQICDQDTSYYYPLEGKVPWRFIWTAFHGDTAAAMVNSIVKNYGYVFDLPRERGIIKELEAYKSYRNAIRAFSPLAGAKFVMDVIASVDESLGFRDVELSRSDLVRDAQTFIIENISENVGVNEIAERLGISREHFSRVFHEQTGISPNRYIIKEKIRLACSLLKETKLDCKEIAQRTGYDNPASFNRVFRKVLNMTPMEFKAMGHLAESL